MAVGEFAQGSSIYSEIGCVTVQSQLFDRRRRRLVRRRQAQAVTAGAQEMNVARCNFFDTRLFPIDQNPRLENTGQPFKVHCRMSLGTCTGGWVPRRWGREETPLPAKNDRNQACAKTMAELILVVA